MEKRKSDSPAQGGAEGNQSYPNRPPAKRARKAINCEPCRASKLKCDRSRPCSSCVLRGTAAQCYVDRPPPNSGLALQSASSKIRGDSNNSAPATATGPIDVFQEIASVRRAMNNLEAHYLSNDADRGARLTALTPLSRESSRVPNSGKPLKQESDEGPSSVTATPAGAGMLGVQDREGGEYFGPTSTAIPIAGLKDDSSARTSEEPQEPYRDYGAPTTGDYVQRPVPSGLPDLPDMDRLFRYYFEFCNWVYRHINEPWFMHAWQRYQYDRYHDACFFPTVCVILAVAVHYLPDNDSIFLKYSCRHEELGEKFYAVMKRLLRDIEEETIGAKTPVEFIELQLLRCHFLTLGKAKTDEVWAVTGEVRTQAVAMGLHRDPGRWNVPVHVAERRRWAWWHIVLLERWQAFMFGRPLSIAPEDYDTLLPSQCDPAVDRTGRLYLPNIALLRLASCLGQIMKDAVSLKEVPYETIQRHDAMLAQWEATLPEELNMDQYKIAGNLSSRVTSERRLGVQSVIIRAAYYHIRFSLHRRYATPPIKNGSTIKRVQQSVDTAVQFATKLVNMFEHAQPEFHNYEALAVPGHLNWGPFHCYSAAMFFTFQLIGDPGQKGSNHFRTMINTCFRVLRESHTLPLAQKALDVLTALGPLHSPDFSSQSEQEQRRQRRKAFKTLNEITLPYHVPSAKSRGAQPPNMSSPDSASTSSLAHVSPNVTHQQAVQIPNYSIQSQMGHQHDYHPVSSVRTDLPTPTTSQVSGVYPSPLDDERRSRSLSDSQYPQFHYPNGVHGQHTMNYTQDNSVAFGQRTLPPELQGYQETYYPVADHHLLPMDTFIGAATGLSTVEVNMIEEYNLLDGQGRW